MRRKKKNKEIVIKTEKLQPIEGGAFSPYFVSLTEEEKSVLYSSSSLEDKIDAIKREMKKAEEEFREKATQEVE